MAHSRGVMGLPQDVFLTLNVSELIINHFRLCAYKTSIFL